MHGWTMSSVPLSRLAGCLRMGLAIVLVLAVEQSGATLRVDAMTMPDREPSALVKQASMPTMVEPVSISLPALSPQKSLVSDERGVRQVGVARDVEQTATAANTGALLQWLIPGKTKKLYFILVLLQVMPECF